MFDLDPCCDGPANARATTWYTPVEDGLAQPWRTAAGRQSVFANPPYARGITPRWMRKAVQEVEGGLSLCVLLIPARVGTLWYDELVTSRVCCEERRIIGRLKYEHPTDPSKWDPATFDSSIVILRPALASVDYGPPRHTRWDIRELQGAAIEAAS